MYEEVYYRNSLMWLWSQEVLQSAVCKLENQLSWKAVVQFSLSLKAWESADGICPDLSLKSRESEALVWCPGAEDGGLSSSRGSRFALPLLFVLFRPQLIGLCLPALGRATCCTQFISSNIDLFQTHPEIMFHQFSGHPLAQSSWHMKITIAAD